MWQHFSVQFNYLLTSFKKSMCVLTRYVVNWWFGCGHAFRCSVSARWLQGFQDQTVGYVP